MSKHADMVSETGGPSTTGYSVIFNSARGKPSRHGFSLTSTTGISAGCVGMLRVNI